MAKAPAFQFYAADFLTDTAEMTSQEVGVYIRLLAHQWVNGSLHSDPKRLANGVAMDVLEVWPEICHKFQTGEDGRLRNERLEKTRKEQEEYRNKQVEAGKKGANKRWGKDSNPNGDPIDDPNGENMALQSSSSSSSPSSGKSALPNGNESESSASGVKKANGVPYKKLTELYKANCPNMTQPREETSWTDARKTTIRRAWINKPDLEWWEGFFQYCGKSKFLSGLSGERKWKADLFWLLKPENFAKINEGKYHVQN